MDDSIDWRLWSHIGAARLFELAALLVQFPPDRVRRFSNASYGLGGLNVDLPPETPQEIQRDFARVLRLAKGAFPVHELVVAGGILNRDYPYGATLSTRHFVNWAASKALTIPPELAHWLTPPPVAPDAATKESPEGPTEEGDERIYGWTAISKALGVMLNRSPPDERTARDWFEKFKVPWHHDGGRVYALRSDLLKIRPATLK